MSERIFVNQDSIEIVTWRMLPDGQVEALLRLSERDNHLLEDRTARYSIGGFSITPNPPLDSVSVVEGTVLARIPAQTFPDPPRHASRCQHVWVETNRTEHRCLLVKGHPGGCSYGKAQHV